MDDSLKQSMYTKNECYNEKKFLDLNVPEILFISFGNNFTTKLLFLIN